MRLLMKFGGTSVGDGERIRRVVEILEPFHAQGHELAVVVSAMSGVTGQLIDMATESVRSREKPAIEEFIENLRGRHRSALETVAPDYIDEVGRILDARLADLQAMLFGLHILRELSPRSRDYIISFGERLSAPVVRAALRQKGVPSVVLDGCEAGLVTTGQHGDAIVLPEGEAKIRSRILPLLADSVPVIMGYMGCTPLGVVTTLGRSGSDYSATVVGTAIGADEVWIWTDVDGIMTADPRLIRDARVLPSVSYLEAMELSYFGARVMHPRSIEPAMRKNIPIRVKNSFNPSHPGTCIVKESKRDRRVVKALTHFTGVALVNITGAQMIGRPGVARTIFAALAENEINIMMISQGSSEANISLLVDAAQLDLAVSALSDMVKQGIVREVTANPDVAAVAVVGAGMAGTPGISGRIFTAMGLAGINVIMISQGSSEVNVSFVVKESDGPKAVRVLHDEFRLSEEPDE
jgi:aspartate kinase